jgi:hypothetical protein
MRAGYRTPPLGRLAHVHAVGRVRAALEGWDAWRAGGARWRSERRLRWRAGSAAGRREHVPDGEVLWPDDVPDFGGQVWCVEAELTAKTAQRTAAVMAELLTRTRDYGEDVAPGAAPRYAEGAVCVRAGRARRGDACPLATARWAGSAGGHPVAAGGRVMIGRRRAGWGAPLPWRAPFIAV